MVRKGDLDIVNVRPVIEGLERRLLMSGAWNVALIDSTLAESDLLVGSADGADCVAVYDGSADSMTDILSGLADQANSAGAQIASLAILSHGSAGQFALGDESISNSSLGLTAAAWTELGEVMEDGGNISIYGCNVADGSAAGQALLDRLAALTGTYVFASDDLTGAGGDWELEAASRGAEAELAAGYLVWSAWSGSLMSSVLAMIPVWRGFDPLPVLDHWEKTRPKGKKGTSSRKEPDADETDKKVDRLMG